MAETFDYDSIRSRILTNLSAKTEHQNVFNNGAIVNLIEALSEELEDEMMQDEYLTTENNWSLAQNKSSLLTESKVHNYQVPRKVGATGTIKFGVSEDFDEYPSVIVDLPQWTQVSDDSETVFTTIEASSIPISVTSVDVSVVQGSPILSSTYAEGITDETLIIYNDSIEDVYYELYVNDVEWTAVDTLFDYDSDDTVYEIKSLTDFSGIKITFGDGTYGKLLTSGDTLDFYYVETEGSDGNIVSSDEITTVDSTIYDLDGSTTTVFCTNDDSISGGEDEATLEEIRVNSPNFFQSGDRATTKTDYETIISAFSYVGKVSVTGAYEYNLDNGNDLWAYIDTQDNLVNVIALSTTYEALTEDQQTALTEDIESKNAPTDILTFPDITIIPMVFNMDVSVSTRSLTLSQVKTNIDTNLEDNYSLDNISFYESIFKSDYYALIDGSTGVRKHTSYISLLEETSFTSAYATSIALPLYSIDGSEIQVYVKLTTEEDSAYTLIGTGDSTGYITGEVGYTFSALSRIVLSTGVGTISITSGLEETYSDYDVRIEYVLDDEDIELSDRSHILQYNSSNYTDISYYTGGE